MNKLKIGIIGFGKMGKIRQNAIEKSERAEVVAVYDPNPIQGGKSKMFVANNPEEVLNFPVDAVFICTPNYLIKPLTVSALGKGLHVFAEKPPGINVGETIVMQEEERRVKNKVLMFGFNHRHHGSVAQMKEIIESQSLGKVLWMRGRYGKEGDENYLKDWRVDPTKSGGGIMLDQGIHMLDLMLYLG